MTGRATIGLTMTDRICAVTSPRRQRLIASFLVTGAALFLFVLCQANQALAADGAGTHAAQPCALPDAAFNTAIDVHALDEYADAIARLLKQEKFSDLDCIADAERAGKSRFSGGAWKLRYTYIGLDSPRPGHPTQEDWKKHIQLIERWRDSNSHSVTARIALAESYVSYAWDARGDGFSDSVSDSGWKLFHERLEKAKSILDHSAALAQQCPDWYVAMQQVARGESWDMAQFKALLDKAVAFEPGYQYYYRIYADYLQPKWSGEEGDPARFAEETANRVGGDNGDTLYYLISEGILCGCQESEFGHFSWPRLQKGFAALEKKYGTSLISVNAFALMASKSGDFVAADPAFKRMGDNWNKDLWVTEAFFKSERDIAAQMAPLQAKSRAYRQEAEANMKSAEGQAYAAEFQPKFAAYEQGCLKESKGEEAKFDFLVQVGKTGTVEDAHTEKQPGSFSMCLMKALYESYVKKETPFPAPPKEEYKMILEIDPTTLNAAAK